MPHINIAVDILRSWCNVYEQVTACVSAMVPSPVNAPLTPQQQLHASSQPRGGGSAIPDIPVVRPKVAKPASADTSIEKASDSTKIGEKYYILLIYLLMFYLTFVVSKINTYVCDITKQLHKLLG